jgi:hypothetical protein
MHIATAQRCAGERASRVGHKVALHVRGACGQFGHPAPISAHRAGWDTLRFSERTCKPIGERDGITLASDLVGSGRPTRVEEVPMRCTKCEGLMVSDHLIDIRESSIPMWMRGWRCVACGNIVDRLILRHRMIQRAGATRLLNRRTYRPPYRKAVKAVA